MIKFIGASSNPQGVSPEDARTHYELRHPALIDTVPSFNRYMLLYIQNYAIDLGIEFSAPATPFLNCSEIWFESEDSLLEAYEVPDYQLLREDEKRFGNFENLGIALAEDVSIYGGRTRPRFKLIRFLERHPNVEIAQLNKVWQEDYAAAILESEAIRGLTQAYIQNRALIGTKIAFPVKFADGVDEFWFASPHDIPRFLQEEQAIAERLDLGRVIDRAGMKQVATESRILPGYALSAQLLKKF